MTSWLTRGLVFAAVMVLARLIQGPLINTWITQAAWISIVLLLIVAVLAFVWGVIDGRADARANPDPDRRQDLAMTWLLAGLVAGAVSGAVTWFISLFDKALYVGGLVNELTTFAAFTALTVFVQAIAAVSVGRRYVDRQFKKAPQKHHGLMADDDDRADTDVFAAVRPDTPIETYGAPQGEEQTGAVATAEREAPTETIPTIEGEAPTEVIHTDTDTEQTQQTRPRPETE